MLLEVKKLFSKGLCVIPVSKESKIPAVKWKEFQTRMPKLEEIEEWFKDGVYDVGIVTGKISKVLLLDVDLHKVDPEFKWWPIPATWQEKTKHGFHYYFKWTEELNDLQTNTTGELGKGIDTKGEGGYSRITPTEGLEWINSPFTTLLAEPPEWLVSFFKKKKEEVKVGNKQGWVGEALDNVEVGMRDTTFFKVAAKMWNDGWQAQDIYTVLKPHAERVGFTLTELDAKVKQVSKYSRGEQILEEVKNQSEDTYSISSFLEIEDKVEWIVPGVIAEKSLNFLVGLPETGKTWCAIDLAVECAKGGGYWLEKFRTKDCKVLYIDQERWRGETKRRFGSIIKAKSINQESLKGNLFIKSGTAIRLDLQHSFDSFKREIEKLRPTLITVDSFATFHTKEENNRKEIQEVIEKIKQIRNEFGCSFLFIDHENKSVFSDEDKTPSMTKMVGSIAKPAAAECILTVRKDANGSMVYNTKNTLAPAIEPFLVKVEDTENGGISVKAF